MLQRSSCQSPNAPHHYLRRTPANVPREAIEQAVIQVFGIAYKDLRRTTRGRAKVALARQVAMYLAHVGCGLSLTETGRCSNAIAPRWPTPAASSRIGATTRFSTARSTSSSGRCRR